MSGEIFFNFDVKPVKKRKTQARENQMESPENREEDISLMEDKSERKKHQNGKLDAGIWKRIDYAKANAVDTMGFYGGSKQNETEHTATIRRKPHSMRKSRKKSRYRQKIRGKEKEKRYEKDDEDQISLSGDNDDTSEEDDKERKKQKIRKTKRSHESSVFDIDKKSARYRSKMKNKHRPLRIRHKDSEHANVDEAAIELGEQATHISPSLNKLRSRSFSPEFADENMKTALCASSTEALMPDDDINGAKPSISYETMYSDISRSKHIDMQLSVELRYWAVLAVFICLLIIYRSFLSPLQCDTQFQ